MTRIQRKGPFTIVAETWSGGVAMLLANLLYDANHEVSLFSLQGFPRKMYSLLPREKSIEDYLVDVLSELIEKVSTFSQFLGPVDFRKERKKNSCLSCHNCIALSH